MKNVFKTFGQKMLSSIIEVDALSLVIQAIYTHRNKVGIDTRTFDYVS